MAKRKLPEQSEVREAFLYNPSSGQLFWRHRSAIKENANSRLAGKPAGGVNKSLGYVQVRFNDVLYYAHQLIWIYLHGSIPEGGHIDHKNCDKADNRPENLRLATPSQNQANRRMTATRKLPKGVYCCGKRFEAICSHTHLGVFNSIAEAKEAYDAYASKLFGEYHRSA